MTRYRLCAGISHRSFADCAIILDVKRDRYWRVGGEAAATLDQLCRRTGDEADHAQLGHLYDMHLIEPDHGTPIESPPELPTPISSALEVGGAPANGVAREFAEVAWRCATARRMVRRKPLSMILDQLRNRRANSAAAMQGEQLLLARKFKRGRQAVPFANQCLPDTLAFLAFMASRGHYPHLVFGVEAYPFAAHCWAQTDEIVLNDALDHARRFAPILVV